MKAKSPISRPINRNSATPSKKSEPVAKATPSIRKKPDWDSYLTDADRFKLTKEELLLKKQSLVSPNNIFSMFESDLSTPSTRSRSTSITSASKLKGIKKRLSTTQPTSTYVMNNADDKNGSVDQYENISALDLIATPAPKHSMKPVTAPSAATTIAETTPDDEYSKNMDDYGSNIAVYPQKRLFAAASPKPIDAALHTPTNAANNHISSKSNHKQTPSRPVKSHPVKTSKHNMSHVDSDYDGEMQEIVHHIQSLHHELRYYEQLSGRRSSLASEDMMTVLDTIAVDDAASMKTVMKALVELVSTSMSYLLKAELEHTRQQSNYQLLNDRLDAVAANMMPSSSSSMASSSSMISSSPAVSKQVDLLSTRRAVAPTFIPSSSSSSSSLISSNPTMISSSPAISSSSSSSSATGGTATDWLFAYTTAHANNNDTSSIISSSSSSSSSSSNNNMMKPKHDDKMIVANTPMRSPHLSSSSGVSSTAVTPAMHVNTASSTSSSSPDRKVDDAHHDVDEDTISLYRYLSSTGSYLNNTPSYDHHHETNNNITSSIYGMKPHHHQQQQPSSAHTDHAYDSQPSSTSSSIIQPHKIKTMHHPSSSSTHMSHHHDHHMSKDDDHNLHVFDDLVKRLTFTSPSSHHQPSSSSEAGSMVQARIHVPAPTTAPRHPYRS